MEETVYRETSLWYGFGADGAAATGGGILFASPMFAKRIPPLVAVFFLRTWGTLSSVPDSRSILLVTLLAAITPTAATITQMAQLYDQDAAYASAINVMTTVVCVVTMPLMVMLYMM